MHSISFSADCVVCADSWVHSVSLSADCVVCTGGWVHSVSFNADGNRVCWVGHDSSVSVADASKEMAKTQLKTPHLPFTAITWISHNTILAAVTGSCSNKTIPFTENKIYIVTY